MKAFKCDRCGKFFGKYKLTNEYSYRGGPISVCHVLGNGESKETLDLCEDCREKLVEFMFMKTNINKSCDTCRFANGILCDLKLNGGSCEGVDGWEPKEDSNENS